MKLQQYIFASLFALGAWSCSDSSEPPQPSPSSGEDCLVSIEMPVINFGYNSPASRAAETDPVTGTEGTLHSLYFVVFKFDEETQAYKQFLCENKVISGSTPNVTPNYELSYSSAVRLSPGKYKFYALGNIFEHWDGGTNTSYEDKLDNFLALLETEDGIKNIQLTYNSDVRQDQLPMVSLSKSICIDSEDGTSQVLLPEGVLQVTEADVQGNFRKTIYAPLSILCSKVRFTLLYDNNPDGEQFSSSFPSSADIQVTENLAVNDAYKYFSFTALPEYQITDTPQGDPGEDNPGDEATEEYVTAGYSTRASTSNHFDIPSNVQDPVKILKVVFPKAADNTEAYLDITNASAAPANLNTTDSWNPSTQRAWQSLMYLPANPDSENLTSFDLRADGDGAKEQYTITLKELKEGTFYDIVAKFLTSEVMAVVVKVQVNPWTYNPEQSVSW